MATPKRFQKQSTKIPKPTCQHKLAGYNLGHITCAHCKIEWLLTDSGWKLVNW